MRLGRSYPPVMKACSRCRFGIRLCFTTRLLFPMEQRLVDTCSGTRRKGMPTQTHTHTQLSGCCLKKMFHALDYSFQESKTVICTWRAALHCLYLKPYRRPVLHDVKDFTQSRAWICFTCPNGEYGIDYSQRTADEGIRRHALWMRCWETWVCAHE